MTFCSFFSFMSISRAILTPIADRQEPWWFFGWVFLAGTVPWTVPALRVLVSGWRGAARPIQPDLVSVDLGGVHLRVFLAVRLEAHALHLAGDAGLGGADRRAAAADLEARFAGDGHLDDRGRRWRWARRASVCRR